jgi:tetratricopeptide (TPR) repeat protein
VGLADCYNQLGDYQIERPSDAFPKARAAVARALELDENLAEAHTSLAFGLLYYDWNYGAAEAEFKRAIELNPNYSTARHWYGEYLLLAGRSDEGLAQLHRAKELDPLSLIINTTEGSLYYYARRYDEAIERLKKTLELNPNFAPALSYLCMAYTEKGMYERAIELYRKMSEESGGEHMLAGLAHVYARAGRKNEARKVISRIKGLSQSARFSSIYWALAYVALGDDDETMKWLEKAYEEKENWMLYLNIDSRFDPLRSDPRFRSLIERVGLPQNR